MPRIFEASYATTYTFKVPTSVFLLDQDDETNDRVQIGSWWIRCAVFHYIDADGKEVEIEYDVSCENPRPEIVEEVDPESDDEEEEEEVPKKYPNVGCIIDCPAARAIEAAGLAASE